MLGLAKLSSSSIAKIRHQLANQIFSRLKDLEFNHTRIKLLAGYFKDK